MKHKLAVSATMLLWVLLILLVLWLIFAAIWWAMSVFSFDELLLPDAVKASIYNYMVVLLWIALLLLYFKMREKRISAARKAERENDMAIVMGNGSTYIIESENVEDTDGMEVLTSGYAKRNIKCLSDPQLLSYAVNLFSKGYEVRALSVLRIIVNKSSTPPVIRNAAYYYMMKIINSNKKAN